MHMRTRAHTQMCAHTHTHKLTAFRKLPCLPLSFSFPSPSLRQIPQPLAYITYKKNHLPGVCAGLVPRYVWTGPSHPEFLPTVPSIDPSQSRSLRCILTTTPRRQLYFAHPFFAHQPPRCFKLTWELLFISTSP